MSVLTGSGVTVMTGRKLDAGGQGEVYAVTAPSGQVFKKYLRTTLDADPGLARRLSVMVTHRPAEWREPQSGHVMLAWPSETVTENGRFAGYLMPVVDIDNTVGLHRITNPTDRREATGATAWAQGFTWRYLVRTAANLAQVTHVLHQAGTVIGDFNESNVRVTREARVTLLDCDSMQITDPDTGERFLCPVGRPEFTPPELLEADWKTTVRRPSSDLFALAVHLYQLLLEGEHPFRGAWSGAGDKPPAPDLARQGMWAHDRHGQLHPRPSAIGISLLPDAIVEMFRRAFEEGAVDPAARPGALEWQLALTNLQTRLRECGTNKAHIYDGDLRSCPWCLHSVPAVQQPLPPAPQPPGIAALVTAPQRTAPPTPVPSRAVNSPIVTRPPIITGLPVRQGTSGSGRRRRGGLAATLIGVVGLVAAILVFVIGRTGASGPQSAEAQPDASALAAQAHLTSAKSWRAVPMALPAGAAGQATQDARLWTIACPAAATCVAAGDYLDAGKTPQGLIETLSHGRWIPAEAPVRASHEAASLDGMACANAGACVAVGSYEYDHGNMTDGLIETLSHGTWTFTKAPLPADAVTGNHTAILQSVACPAADKCVAVGGYQGQGSASPGLIETLSQGTWTPSEAPLPAGAALTRQASINDVTCPAAGTCVAVGTYVDQNSVYQTLVETLADGTWTATEIPPPTGAVSSKDSGLGAVSCPSGDACVATGWYNYSGNPFQASPNLIATSSGGTWLSAGAPVPAKTSVSRVALNGVSCPAADNCVAAGSYDYSNPNKNGKGLMEVLSHGTWAPVKIRSPSAAATSNYFQAISCPEVGECVAAGAYSTASGGHNQALIETTVPS